MENHLRTIRKARGLSQEELAKQIGYDFRTISSYENTDRPIPRKFLEKASQALGVTPEELQSHSVEDIREETVEYRPRLPTDLLRGLSQATIEQMLHDYTAQLARAEGVTREILFANIATVSEELTYRSRLERTRTSHALPSSIPASETAAAVAAAEAVVEHEPPESAHSPKAAGSTAQTPSPSADASQGSTKPPAAPKPAPKSRHT